MGVGVQAEFVASLSFVVPGDGDLVRSGIYRTTEVRYLGYGKLRL
jgi:hypothetical protein